MPIAIDTIKNKLIVSGAYIIGSEWDIDPPRTAITSA